jgi:hypothetical protein
VTGHRDGDAELTEFLLERAGRLPDRAFEAVDAAARTTPQLRAVPAELPMQRRRLDPRALLAVAAVVVVAVGLTVGGYLPDLRNLVGAGAGSARPSGLQTAAGPATPPPSTPELSAPTEVDPFSGTWSTLDEDGSQMTLVFDGTGSTRSVHVTDLRATLCAGGPYRWEGTGPVTGNEIEIIGVAGCTAQAQSRPFSTTYTYDAASGTLRSPVNFRNGDHVTWARGPIPLDAFRGRWVATDIDGTTLELILEGSDGLDRSVRYHDEHAQFCTGEPGYTAEGQGRIGSVEGDGRFLRATLIGSCDDGSSPREWDHKYEFDWATGTLIGPLVPLEIGGTRGIEAVVWSRP